MPKLRHGSKTEELNGGKIKWQIYKEIGDLKQKSVFRRQTAEEREAERQAANR